VRVPGFGLRTGAAIPLGPRITPGLKRPTRGSSGPGQPFPPIWPCSARGLPCRPDCSETRWALTPPFHPYRWAVLRPTPEGSASGSASDRHRRSVFCGTFRDRALADPTPWRYQARCPVESGLSSHPRARVRGRPARPSPCWLFYRGLPWRAPTSFSNSSSVRILTPSCRARSYFEPGSAPTTT